MPAVAKGSGAGSGRAAVAGDIIEFDGGPYTGRFGGFAGFGGARRAAELDTPPARCTGARPGRQCPRPTPEDRCQTVRPRPPAAASSSAPPRPAAFSSAAAWPPSTASASSPACGPSRPTRPGSPRRSCARQRHRADRAAAGRDAAREAAGGSRAPRINGGLSYREVLAGPAAGGRAERAAAAAGRVQVPRGAGHQLGPPGEPRLAGLRPLAADLLGAGPLQSPRRPRRRRTSGWRMGAVDEAKVPVGRQGAGGVRAGDGRSGTSPPPTPPRPRWPARPAATSASSCSPATAPATSATSATRRSTSPTASARWSASAGSTPSRCCGRWRTRC